MATPTQDATFANMFIANAQQCLKSGEMDWALQALLLAIDAVKIMKKAAAQTTK